MRWLELRMHRTLYLSICYLKTSRTLFVKALKDRRPGLWKYGVILQSNLRRLYPRRGDDQSSQYSVCLTVTTTCLGCLRLGLWVSGRSNQAKIQQCLLELSRDTCGLEHPDTISAMSNLASILGDQGKLDEAANMKKDVLEKRTRILGAEHHRTTFAAKSLNALSQRQASHHVMPTLKQLKQRSFFRTLKRNFYWQRSSGWLEHSF